MARSSRPGEVWPYVWTSGPHSVNSLRASTLPLRYHGDDHMNQIRWFNCVECHPFTQSSANTCWTIVRRGLTTSRHDSSTNSFVVNTPPNTSSATAIPIQSHHLVVSLKQWNPKSMKQTAQHPSESMSTLIPAANPQTSMAIDSVLVAEGGWRKTYSSALVQGVHVTASQVHLRLPFPNYWHRVVNTNPASRSGRHWVCICVKKGRLQRVFRLVWETTRCILQTLRAT